MTAKELISPSQTLLLPSPERHVPSDMPALEVLPRLLDAPGRVLGVVDADATLLGIIDSASMLEGLSRVIASRDDCSTIVVSCAPADFSASLLGHAVEDADAHLVDMLTVPDADGRLRVTLRVRHCDPTSAVHSLERHNYEVVYARGAGDADASVSAERLEALRMFLNV